MLKINVMNFYKITGIFLVLGTMAICQFHREAGAFLSISVPKEMWTIITNIITNTFISVSGIKVTAKSGSFVSHVKGGVTIILILMVGLSVYYSLELGREWWAALGTATAFLYEGSGSSEQ